MTTTPKPVLKKSRRPWWLAAGGAALAALVWGFFASHQPADPVAVEQPGIEHAAGPPWRYGPASARFTIVVYADLECPFCQSYTPVLRTWVDGHRDVNLQWHHLPLAMHEPAASEEARWVECVGETFGHARFWEAIAWVYQHTRGGGQGLPPGTAYPDDAAVQACLDSERPGLAVRQQADQARNDGLNATPSIRLIDQATDRSMVLTGPVVGDALLSALDYLASEQSDEAQATPMPAEALNADAK
ncbi:thioredoxin domain-containing protein [Pseudomonas amygdali]|uniref:DsbA family protein n=1 Tax=Pseudomonas amygdali TaxID=47877 RepID=UPI001CD82F8A|nr:thioredoxin domain-containing protein [Pseudomonas amygdali]UBT80423.1 thioredoxin domain-containing protein [Pseudomonas amygdali]